MYIRPQMLLATILATLIVSCDDSSISSLGGDVSPMAEVGVTISSSSFEIAGVSSINGEVTALNDGISSVTGSAVITNSNIKNILSNFPEATVEGDNVSITDIEFKQTTEGIASIKGLAEGIIVKYDAEVGDEYKTEDGIRRVVSRSTEDDYFYGFFLIKVIEVEENLNKQGIKTIRYWANHRFGLVGIEFTYDDNSISKFPVYLSTENP